MFVCPARAVAPAPFVISDGACLECGQGVDEHKVVFPPPDDDDRPDFAALGLALCSTEAGGDSKMGTFLRYICRVLAKEPDTMSREEFEELYR